ncbi:ATP-dependent zinc protease [Gallaecimonas pentaromativorans]|uniref:Retropepsin-like aspartic endopeptidase domain-containing protein n=1 Tax=Gallaecimonas pentaromativorans TaxID=584787 RepID=A0A3N1PIM8_9GAMM|nr:RimK/LysX family protein [Gallaecimonas pentaromativorans]MED5524432.1 RimK/LysX family protein [Pseudomonadota bacterium]ROQ28443.1 hypothetical protein EDC28_10335 [Gallaecimonas pentaromativorans]
MRKALLLLGGTLLLQACAQTQAPAPAEKDINHLQVQLDTLHDQQNQHLATLEAKQAQAQQQILSAQAAQQATLAAIAAKLNEKQQPVVCPQTPQLQCPETKPMPVKDDKLVVGALEKVRLHPSDVVLTARIDTGATSASLDARDIQKFERDGADWVRFKVPTDDKGSDYMEVERKVLRWVRIIQSSSEDGERRPVVEFKFDIGPISQKAEFNLSDRSHLEFPVLIGRNILKDVMVVDVGKEYSLKLPPMKAEDKDAK